MIWVTADHHFGHANIIQLCGRPFGSVTEMDRAMIDAWNAVVGPEDTVYHLGDFTLAGSLAPWVHALRFGALKIVPGSHDRRWLARFGPEAFGGRVEVLPPLMSLELPGEGQRPRVVVLCHYPLLSWDRQHYRALHLHGHSHGRGPGREGQDKGRRVDVGVDCWSFAPVALAALERQEES